MADHKIKDINLASQINKGELAWYEHASPITQHYARQSPFEEYRIYKLPRLI